MPEFLGKTVKVKTKVVDSINVTAIYGTLIVRVKQGIDASAEAAFAQAERDVPVRKVFKYTRKNVGSRVFAEQRIMGRQETRTLNLEEALSESVVRRRLKMPQAFRTYESNGKDTGRRIVSAQAVLKTAQFGRIGDPGSYRAVDRANLSPDDAHVRAVRRISGVNRLVTEEEREDKLGHRVIPHLVSESDLSVRGRFELKRANQTLGGALKRSLQLHPAVVRGGRVKARVSAGGGDVDYAKYVEFGTRRSRAQPFLRPALAKARVELAATMKTALKGGV